MTVQQQRVKLIRSKCKEATAALEAALAEQKELRVRV